MEHALIQRILVVDDEEEYRVLVQRYLQGAGYACEISSDAAEALDRLEREPFDLVISDIRMKGKDGLELMREAMAQCERLSFIIMSGYTSDYSYSDIINEGAADFISKPFQMEELRAKLERIEREKSILRELRQMNESLSCEAQINASFAELSRALLSPLSFDSISDIVFGYAKQLTSSSIGFVGYIDRNTGYLVSSTMSRDVLEDCRVADTDTVFKKFEGLWGWVLENQSPILSNAPQEDSRSSGVPEGHVPIHRFLCAPAIADKRLLGLIALANAPREYNERDLVLIERLASIHALAIRRKWVDEELKETEEELRRARDELEKLVEERTAKLSRAGELIKRSIHKFKEIAEGEPEAIAPQTLSRQEGMD